MLSVVSSVMLILGFLLLILSIFLTFLWRIPDIADELSGRKAKRQIKRLREINVGLGESSSLSTNDLYEVVHSGNLVWESIDSGKESRVNFDEEVSFEEDYKESEEQGIIIKVLVEQTSLKMGMEE